MVKKSNKNEKEKKELKDTKKVKDTKKTKGKKVDKKDNKKVVKVKKKPFAEFKSEFSKIKWPTKKEMVKYSIATIVFVVFFALFFFAVQSLMSLLLRVL